MNVNPTAKTVLCFGDSNTRGRRPDQPGRYGPDIRWTGVLQAGLANNYYVIEEGRSGRTTDMEHSLAPGRNGRLYLQPCLESHNPLDIIIIMLGTNDLKIEFNRTAQAIGKALEGLLDDVRQYAQDRDGRIPKIIVVSPIYVADHVVETDKRDIYGDTAAAKSRQLAEVFNEVAKKYNAIFFDAAKVAGPGLDGIHIDEAGHKALGQGLTKVVLSV